MYESLSYGVRIGQWELRHHDFKQIPCIYPPFEEQEMIAQYLDKQIKHIAKIIEKKEKLILLLKEQQNSYMTHYVTKGLNPNAVKKKTGINWIGKIPRDWTTVPLKRVFSDFFGGSWGKEPIPGQKEHLVNVIRVTEFNMETHMVKNDLPTIRSLTLQDGSKKLVQKNDIILEKSGGGEKTPVGRVVLCDLDPDYPTVNSNFTNLCRPNIEVIDPKYCVYLLTSLHRSGAVMQNINQTTGIQNLDIDAYMSDHVVLPPLDDQKKIVNKINKYSNKIMNLINKYKEQINLLKEYQKSLISFSVTGKVRVMRDML
jgi:type I restriction enzyme S subunit